MRTRRFRPLVDFRPSLDHLMPRIAPSDIAVMLYLNGDPPTSGPAQTDPGQAPTGGVSASAPYSTDIPVTAS